ncbi:hypothetical protein F1188_11835 [Roseospira marina]|uniref:VPLPA-CTERM sorting domain-containing protein n=1 Tax=Roseospira marina TaxID=140057 RepID=A0A5M6IAF8_9PROT|nr:VPLPA-CTERM sorting domain-containing protein [Roseospira marina]KAA5605254.1 hypothetical protein F1188_11835 [Roseospira marina]MBB4314713.1 hypothetical protein [Roseospira marina]
MATDTNHGSSLAFSSGGVSGTITAELTGIGSGMASPAIIEEVGDGLGIRSSWIDPDDDIDSEGFEETMVFTFDRVVQLDFITFGDVDSDDDWTISVNGTTVNSQSDPFYFSNYFSNIWADTFTVSAFRDGLLGLNADDSFTIQSFGASVVPLPAAAWFLLTAVGGLFGGRWLRGSRGAAAA